MSHFPEDQDKKPRDPDGEGAPENAKNEEFSENTQDESQPNEKRSKKITFRRLTGPIKITPPDADERTLTTGEEIVQELSPTAASGELPEPSEPVKFFPDAFFEEKLPEEYTPADYQRMMREAALGEPIMDEIRQALEQHPSMLYVPKTSTSLEKPPTETPDEIPEEIAAKAEPVAFPDDISVQPEPVFVPETPETATVAGITQEEESEPEPELPPPPPLLQPEPAFQPGLLGYMTRIGAQIENWICTLGDFTYFACQVFWWVLRLPRRGTLLPCMYEIGIMSLPVIALTGTFIGMVLAVQSYHQLKDFYLETRMGALINLSLVRELGPVLAATMLAGRIGSSMAAELGTMRVTEQIDAMDSMGVNPVHYLVVPRFLGCMLLIPVLTIVADFMGIVGGGYLSIWVYGVDWCFYLTNSNKIVGAFDIFIGVFKSVFFGAAIGLIGCHRGFNSRAGAEGVGKAATEAFVFSFVTILMLDLALGIMLDAFNATFISTGPKQI